MAADAGISKAAAKKGLESFLGSVSGTLKKGGRVFSSRIRIMVSV
jgi:DNA-binding protein HU-beta